jgi:restriction endonuclease S subunit
MSELGIPNGWVKTQLGEIFTFIGGGTPDKSNPNFWNGSIPWASVKDIKSKFLYQTQDFISENAIEESATNIAYINDVILATRINPGKSCITKIKCTINQDLKIVKSNSDISPLFIFYLFREIESKILNKSSGTTVLGITLNNLNAIDFLLPPLPEQHRIVAKIEELFSELDKGIETLKTAQQQLKVYRQAVLKYAFEGRLTNPGVKDGELPEGWVIKSLAKIGEWRGGGTPSKSNPEFWTNGTIDWVTSKDMKSDVINSTIDRITPESLEFSSAKMIPANSVLIVMRSGILRRTLPICLVTHDVTINQDLQAITPFDIDAKYLLYCLKAFSEKIRNSCSKDGTTVESIDSS